jgi:hypothetical protein
MFVSAVVLSALIAIDPFVRIGSVGRHLSGDDVAQIQSLASQAGRRAWLALGLQSPAVAHLWSVDVFLEPDAVSPRARRGRMMTVTASRATFSANKAWTVTATGRYGQVSWQGRDFDQVENDRDLNQPFELSGDFTDAELVSLVDFVRSSPKGPKRKERTPYGNQVQGRWPIHGVRRQPDGSIRVSLRRDAGSRQIVHVGRDGPDWRVTGVGLVMF